LKRSKCLTDSRHEEERKDVSTLNNHGNHSLVRPIPNKVTSVRMNEADAKL